MKIQKIIIFAVICLSFNTTVFAATSIDKKADSIYNTVIKQISTKSVDNQLLYIDRLNAKINILIGRNISLKNKLIYKNLRNKLENKSKSLVIQKNITKPVDSIAQDLAILIPNEPVKQDKQEVKNNTGNITVELKSNTGELNKTDIKSIERKKLDMSKEFNQIISSNYFYKDFFTSGSLDIPEENKIVINKSSGGNEGWKSFYIFTQTGAKLAIIDMYKVSGIYNLENSRYFSKEILKNSLYFYINGEGDINKDKIQLLPKAAYTFVDIPYNLTKLPIDLLVSDISRDKYDMETRIKYLKELDDNTQAIIRGKNSDFERIKAIYNWMTDNNNITYDYDAANKIESGDYGTGFVMYNQSGLATYKLKTGVCAGIAKLFVYMLHFADIKDVEYTVGYTFSGNFGFKVGHAWVRVGDYYYDPTWDLYAKDRDRFFRLPRDLLYATRTDGNDSNYSYYAGLNQAQLNKIMEDNYRNLIPTYKDKYYYHLQPYLYLESK